jgi:hypothetical protein
LKGGGALQKNDKDINNKHLHQDTIDAIKWQGINNETE